MFGQPAGMSPVMTAAAARALAAHFGQTMKALVPANAATTQIVGISDCDTEADVLRAIATLAPAPAVSLDRAREATGLEVEVLGQPQRPRVVGADDREALDGRDERLEGLLPEVSCVIETRLCKGCIGAKQEVRPELLGCIAARGEHVRGHAGAPATGFP